MKKNLFLSNILLILLVVFIDQLTKFAVGFLLNPLEIVSIGIRMSLAPTLNTQFAFSLPAPTGVIVAVVAVVFLAVVFNWQKLLLAQSQQSYWLALILGGALGNIFDRIYRGGVLDFIELSVASWHWSSFNIADLAIVAGALGWIIFASRPRKVADSFVSS